MSRSLQMIITKKEELKEEKESEVKDVKEGLALEVGVAAFADEPAEEAIATPLHGSDAPVEEAGCQNNVRCGQNGGNNLGRSL